MAYLQKNKKGEGNLNGRFEGEQPKESEVLRHPSLPPNQSLFGDSLQRGLPPPLPPLPHPYHLQSLSHQKGLSPLSSRLFLLCCLLMVKPLREGKLERKGERLERRGEEEGE